MTEPVTDSQRKAMGALNNLPASRRLSLSSAQAGWEELEVQAFYEPRELEGQMVPASADLSLILLTAGALCMELRLLSGPWETANLHQGDLILRPGGGPPYEVQWKSLSSVPPQNLHLRVSKNLLVRVAEEVAGQEGASGSLVERAGFRDPLLTQIGLTLLRELEQPAPAANLYAQTAAHLLAVHLLRSYASGGGGSREPQAALTSGQMRAVSEFVQDHLNQDISLEVLAHHVGFSPSYFARLFRLSTGESPHQFVLRQRIERAQQRLEEKNLPLAQVATECGFANQSHFTQVFKRSLGLTPRAYRQDRSISTEL